MAACWVKNTTPAGGANMLIWPPELPQTVHGAVLRSLYDHGLPCHSEFVSNKPPLPEIA